jgi:hypothetical protein
MATTTYIYSVPRQAGPPPITILGYFSGTPVPAMPVCRVPTPVLRAVSARCCVTSPFLPMGRWYVSPPSRYVFPPVLVYRR